MGAFKKKNDSILLHTACPACPTTAGGPATVRREQLRQRESAISAGGILVKLAKAELKKRIEAWWKIAPPKTKRTVILAGCLLVLGLMMFFSSIFMPSEKKQAKKEQAPQVEVMSKRTRSQLYESASVRRLRGRVDSLEKSVDKVKKDIGEINKTISDIKKSVTISQDQIKVFQTQLIQKAGKLEEIISKAQREKTKKSKKAEKEQKTEKKVPTFSDIWGRST